ncbi:hypothetical protein I6E68_05930 [Salinibacterium sp. NSLL150]|uniref:hypothetical protein n=1 Tax=unclassified Salinibacterium TaxID=2632331 RepID=UPI0018CEEFFB|nr:MULTISPECIES: hypothetical protein [unclassified Salinibacterium]MBH0098679.1 hypothetical protein [Salinibacterium sp. NSLL35]MBH0101434.1 hypothetical protein [Salinibacterium sp. NSLL150]MBH0104193.1 hypothetical protein [Salinibacterium sp. NSLL16]MBH0106954.1 hypothetical protein [Salinibacterium sp. NSLL17]
MRRPDASALVATLTIETLGHEWHPVTPPEGWTPKAVADAAVSFAQSALDVDAPYRRKITEAYRDLMRVLPDVKRAEIVDRLHGIDPLADYLDELQ